MSVVVRAASPFHWYGVLYNTGDVIPTTGLNAHAVQQLLEHYPAYVDSGGGGAEADPVAGPAVAAEATRAQAAEALAMEFVVHGATAGAARPAGANLVHWVGSVAPTNRVTNDEWTDTANKLIKRWTGSVWDTLGSGASVTTRVSASGTARYQQSINASGTYVGSESRSKHRSGVAGRDVELVYCTAYNVGETTPAGTSITFKASVEYPAGTYYPAYDRGGSRTITVQQGGIGKLYVPGVEIPANTDFWVRTLATFTTAEEWPATQQADGATEWANHTTSPGPATDHTTSGTLGANTNVMVTPNAVTVMPYARAVSVLGLGDSITSGKGDPDLAGIQDRRGSTQGWFRRAMSADGSGWGNPQLSNIVVAQSSETAQNYAANNKRRARFGYLVEAAPTHAYVLLGTNDLSAGRTQAQTQTDLLTVWTAVTNRGIKVRAATVPPLTSSTDAFATTTNQTIVNTTNNASRIAVNNWIRDGAPIDATTLAAVAVGTSTNVLRAGAVGHPLVGYVEFADTVESARDSGLWKANYTADGTHPNATGHAAAAACVDKTVITL